MAANRVIARGVLVAPLFCLGTDLARFLAFTAAAHCSHLVAIDAAAA